MLHEIQLPQILQIRHPGRFPQPGVGRTVRGRCYWLHRKGSAGVFRDPCTHPQGCGREVLVHPQLTLTRRSNIDLF